MVANEVKPKYQKHYTLSSFAHLVGNWFVLERTASNKNQKKEQQREEYNVACTYHEVAMDGHGGW